MKKRGISQIRQVRTITVAKHIVATRCTLRQAATQFNVSRVTVHKDMRELLPDIAPDLALQVESILEYNKSIMHLRGGEATRMKWNKRKAALVNHYRDTWA
jgi:putative DeoR family transcriptional regulator (stage III sporulation protein D)